MSLSVEKAKELRLSKMWEEVVSEIDEMIEASRNQMEAMSKDSFDGWKSRIQALKEIKNLPQTVIERDK